MDRFQAMRVFAQVVESASFARAAERLDLSTSAVSRHVGDLEAHLQTRLLNRTTRRLSLTETGRAFYSRCVQLLADLDEAEQEASKAAVEPRGTIRVTSSITFGIRHLAPEIARFLAAHPGVKFDVELSDRIVDLVAEGFDLAIRAGPPGGENLVARRLCETRIVPCASPAYLKTHGAPKTPEDLAAHNCFTYEYASPQGQWRFLDRDGAERVVQVRGTLHSNNGDLSVEAAALGVGIALEPDFIAGPDIRAGRLVPLLQDFSMPPLPIYAVYPTRRHLSAKVRVFVDFLVAQFAASPDWVGAVHTLAAGDQQ
jgi:DNA-binding transcriptional LysR family regulator